MYNETILKHLINEFGIIQAFLFSRMEARKYDLLYQSDRDVEKNYDYERDWWNDAVKRLNNQINEQNEFTRSIEKTS